MIKKGTKVMVRLEGVRPFRAVVTGVEEDPKSHIAKRKVWIRERGAEKEFWVKPEEVSVE